MDELELKELIQEIAALNENVKHTRDRVIELVMVLQMCLEIVKDIRPE